MKIQVARLREILDMVKPAVPKKSIVPAVQSVLLKDGQAVGTDLETMVIIPVPEADIHCLLPFKVVSDLLKHIDGREYLTIQSKGKQISLEWSEGKSILDTESPDNYPEVKDFTPEFEADINSDMLIPAMVSILPYLATEDTRPVLTGVSLKLGEEVIVAGGDGFRMAYQALPLSFPQEKVMIVPSGSVRVLELLRDRTPRTLPQSDTLIPLIMAKKQIGIGLDGDSTIKFTFSNAATAIVTLIQGSPPEWVKLIPKDTPVLKASFMAPQVEQAVRRVVNVAKDNASIVRLVFEGDKVIVSAKYDNNEIQSSVRTIGADVSVNRVAINSSYLLEYLNGKDGIVTVLWAGKASPMVFQHQKDPKVLIMPMEAKWDDDNPEGPEAPESESEDETEKESTEETEPAQDQESTKETEPVQKQESEPAPAKRRGRQKKQP